jgi:DNA replication protein DnaC
MADVEKSIAECCKQLKLSTNFAGQAMTQKGDTPQEYLLNLLTNEIDYRRAKRKSKYLNTAGFPHRYTAGEFRTDEIDFPEGTNLQTLLELDFYHTGKNVIMYGGTGTGKTMLSILIGISACNLEIPVKFYRTAGLINLFSESKGKGTLTALKKKLNSVQILILDEFGYVPYDRTGSQLLFDYLSEIHEQKSVILNTNLEFSQWVNVLYDQRMTTALIGRLTHHVELILFPGVNNRLRESSINASISKISRQEAGNNDEKQKSYQGTACISKSV